MRVLVTGAGGGIGRHAVAELISHGHEVSALTLEAPPTDAPGAEWIRGDVRDPKCVTAAARNVQAVVHLAAIPSPIGHPPEEVYANNTLGTFVVLETAGRLGIQRAVIASSVSALGFAWADRYIAPAYVPVDEQHPLLATEAYGLSKMTDEMTAAMMHRRWGMDTLAFRFPLTATGEAIGRRVSQVQADPGEMANHLWAYLNVLDAAEALRRGVEVDFHGSAVVNVTAPEILGLHGSERLVREHHPQTSIRRPLRDDEVPFDLTRMHEILGFEARRGWSVS